MKEYEISERYVYLPSSEFAEIMRLATEGKDIISLGPGEPDFTTPKHIIDFANEKLNKSLTIPIRYKWDKNGQRETRRVSGKDFKSPQIHDSSFLIEAYVRTEPGHTKSILVHKMDGPGYSLRVNGSGGITFAVSGGGTQATVKSTVAVNDGTWIHILAECDRSSRRLLLSINGKKTKPAGLIERLNAAGGEYGIGRSDLVENRLVGIKSREFYEAPAAAILLEAHKALEGLVLDRETLHFKELVSLKYARLTYDGLWFTPLKQAIDKFVDSTQRNVQGTVNIKLFKGNIAVCGRKSAFSLYREALATYGKGDKFDQSLAKGFIELFGLPYKKK